MKLKKSWILIAAVALLLTFVVSGTIAYLAASTGELVNTFTPGKMNTDIVEEFKNNVKSSIRVKNSDESTISVFVRVSVTGYYVQDVTVNGTPTQVIVAPWSGLTEDMINSTWFEKDGFYYYTKAVEPKGLTDNLLAEGKRISHSYKEGEPYLVVNVIQQSIQSTPETTVEDEWGVTATGNTLSKD